ncbi:MAG: metalloprotease RseP [Parcubacteria group bacterium]|nr:metalloprotease RseP [Parcubacteria group bacterium]
MTVVLFILVLVALIVVHEFGHFLVAKWSGMKVDEFGIGYPPRAWGFKKGETEYTLNWLPFGGFVRIYGEDEQDRVEAAHDSARAFGSRPRILQALVLIAGIAMNLIFAWVLLTTTLALGTPQEIDPSDVAGATDVALLIADVLPGSPAAEAGLKPGDSITLATMGSRNYTTLDPQAFTQFIAGDTDNEPLTIHVTRDDKPLVLLAHPRAGILASAPARPALGVSVALVGSVPVTWWKAPWEGAKLTWAVTKQTAQGLWHFFYGLATFTADLSQVSGPIGIAGAVGTASRHGIAALLSLTAVISINLALINFLPIPALDGGRLLFVVIEAIIRRPLPAYATRAVNTVGFGLLILLMLVVTAHDVFKIFG